MPFILPTDTDNATALVQQVFKRTRHTRAGNPLHFMDIHELKAPSLRDELRLHARYIRDTLVPMLARQSKLTHSDNVLLRSIFKKLGSTHMTLDLLRYSRIEKALMVIAATGASTWPMEVVVQAEALIQKWENQLGPLKNLRSDLYGPGGRLEGVRKISDGRKGSAYEKDDELKSSWSVHVSDPFQSHKYGSLGFEVGDWWLKPAAAYRDGIIDKTSHAITADHNGAYAILVDGSRELDLKANGTFTYHAALDDPGAFKLTKTMTSDTDKIVRILRSWKLRSKLAPKAGLRYDGLYRIESFGIKLLPPNSWHKTFTLSRVSDQPPLSTALAYPMSDQLDDWRDYQRLKNVDRGDDFAVLRELLREPTADMNQEISSEDMEKHDSGYFSRRPSKYSSRINSISNAVLEGKHDVALTTCSRINSLSNSILDNTSELEFTLVAEGTPSTPESEPRTVYPAEATDALDGVRDLFERTMLESRANRSGYTPDLGSIEGHQSPTATAELEGCNETHYDATPSSCISECDTWPNSRISLDSFREGGFADWAVKRQSANLKDEDIGPEETVGESEEAFRGMGRWTKGNLEGKTGSMQQKGQKMSVDTVGQGEEAAKRRELVMRGE